MIDRKLVVWTRLNGNPAKMGELYTTDTDSRFSYEQSYLNQNQRGLGLVYPPEIFGINAISRTRNQYFNFHPPIQSLLPPKNDRNLIRALILRYLNKSGIYPKEGLEMDWELLTKSGHGSIGHLDVFGTDQDAESWYSASPNDDLIEAKNDFGFSLREFLTWMDNDAEQLVNFIGPTPSLGGAIPKIPLSIPCSGWNGYIGLPTRVGSREDVTDIILKFEDSNSYPGIIELEKLGFEMHQLAGFDVPRHWETEIKGIPALAVERFDRDINHHPLFMESIYSVLASANPKFTNHYSATYDFIGKMLGNQRIEFVNEPREAKEYLLRRLILAMLTGNGDLHLENLAILESEQQLKFSPVYDPTPMRAYMRHDMLTPQEMTFGDYGDFIGDNNVGFEQALFQFSKNLGIRKPHLLKIIEQLLTITKEYEEKISGLKVLPDQNKSNLIQIHKNITQKITKLLD